MKEFFLSDLSVEKLIENDPSRISVFERYGTDCVGCLLSRFCTISDVCAAYSIGLTDLARELERTDQKKIKGE